MEKLRGFDSIFNNGWVDADDARDIVLDDLVKTVNLLIDELDKLKVAEARLEEQKDKIAKLESYIIKDSVMNSKTTNRRF